MNKKKASLLIKKQSILGETQHQPFEQIKKCSFADVPDEQLAVQILERSPAAETEFCRRYLKKTLAFLNRQARSPMQAEDIAQETMVTVLNSLRQGKVREPARLYSYVFQTARNLLIVDIRNTIRREQRLMEQQAHNDHAVPDRAILEIIQSETGELLHELLDGLRMPRDRDILIQYYLQDIEKQCICTNMDIDHAHFDRVISRARLRARHTFAPCKQALLSPA